MRLRSVFEALVLHDSVRHVSHFGNIHRLAAFDWFGHSMLACW